MNAVYWCLGGIALVAAVHAGLMFWVLIRSVKRLPETPEVEL
mgnify:CR=1 FL=1